jgi:hypothetical protein
MLPDSVELLFDDGNAHFDGNDIGMDHESAFRFHFKFVART